MGDNPYRQLGLAKAREYPDARAKKWMEENMSDRYEGWQGRQGDLLFIRLDVSEKPGLSTFSDRDRLKYRIKHNLLKPEGDGVYVLATGEKTGHRHVIDGEANVVIENGSTARRIIADEPISVMHDEHPPLELDAGVYKMIRQRQFDYDEFERSQNRRLARQLRYE